MITKAHSETLEIFDHFPGWEISGSIKRHVLEKVGKPLLVVFFHQGTGVNIEPHTDSVRWFSVGQDGKTQAVIENAPSHSWIWIDIAIFLRQRNGVILSRDRQIE